MSRGVLKSSLLEQNLEMLLPGKERMKLQEKLIFGGWGQVGLSDLCEHTRCLGTSEFQSHSE